tara:strand:+ start:1638 stop:1904 length:267 start_codon:yes stop_codon:yes gene_type:complete
MKNETTTQTEFDANRTATYKQVIGVATHFVKLAKCPKDMKFGSFRGYLLNKLNSKAGLKSGEVTAYLNMKTVPVAITNSVRAYKKANS